jgi:hypothetical protein
VLFLYFASFGRKTFKIYQVPRLKQSLQEAKIDRFILERSESNSILDLFAAEKRNRQNMLFLERFKMSTSLYFNHNFFLKHCIAMQLVSFDS